MKIRNEINISCLVKHYFERCKIEFRIKCTKILHQHIPCGLVARIRRFHRRGRGSIPRKGDYFIQYLDKFDVVPNFVLSSGKCQYKLSPVWSSG